MNDFLKKHQTEIKGILAKYPKGQERSSVMAMLHIAQIERGYITKPEIDAIAEIIGMSRTEIASIIGFYTLYHPEKERAKYRILVCTDLACALRGADDFLYTLCKMIGIKPGETTPDGLLSIEEVTCLAACNGSPVFQIQAEGKITYHENQTAASAFQMIRRMTDSGGVNHE